MINEKIFHLDVETTGTDDTKHGLIQFSGMIEIAGEEKETVDLKIAPFPDDEIDPEALEIQDRTEEEIREYMDPKAAYNNLMKIMGNHIDKYDRSDKFHMVGYNVKFDEGFLRAFWDKNDDPYVGSLFHWPSIDVANIVAYRYMKSRSKFKNYKLMTVAEALGMEIDEDKAHDALYDIEVTRKLFHAMSKMLGV